MHQDKHSKKKKRRSGASAARDLVVGLVKTNRTPAPFWPDATAPEMVNSDKPGGADLLAAAVALWRPRQCQQQEQRQQIEEEEKKKKKEAPSKRKNVSVAEEEEKGRTLEELLLVNPSPVAAVEAFSRLSFPPSLFYDCLNHCIPEFWGFGPAQTGIGARA